MQVAASTCFRATKPIRAPDTQQRFGTSPEAERIQYFRIYDLRSTYATRLSADGVADEWVTQMLRQGDAKVFKK